MLNFFRKIRRQLLNQGTLRQYLLYAIGEILLVVLGILIALQIDAWNQASDDRVIERNYLTNLLEDLRADTNWVNAYVIDRFDHKVAALSKIRNYYLGTYEIRDTLAFVEEAGYAAVFGHTSAFSFSRNVYDELVATGNLRKITNERLRSQVNTYYSYLNIVAEGARDYRSGYVNFINSLRPFAQGDTTIEIPFDQQLMLRHLRTEEAYRMCNLELTLAYAIQSRAQDIQNRALALIRSIEEELE